MVRAELSALREALRTLAPEAIPGSAKPERVLSTGSPEFDRTLAAGGLYAGRIAEIAGAASSGKTALALKVLAHHSQQKKLVAYVDGTGQFYPPAAAALGVDLERLLVALPLKHRPATGREVIALFVRTIEIIARSRAFAAVVLDLPESALISTSHARRLRNAVQSAGCILIVLSNLSGAVEGASTRIESWQERRALAFRVDRGGSAPGSRARLASPTHRFDEAPPLSTAPITNRRLPGLEVP